MTKRQKKKLDLLLARAEGQAYQEIAEKFGYERAAGARQAVSLAKKHIREFFPALYPLELK